MRNLIYSLVVAPALLLNCGCQTMDWKALQQPKWPWQKARSNADREEKKSEYVNPARMVAVWTDSVYYSAGGQPTRGFGGRIYFYNDHGQAVPVEGQLAVFVYDDTDVDPAERESRPPDRRYAFTKEQFTKHFSKTDLGASYSVWIPWDPVGGEQRHLTMLPVFTTLDGKVLVGQQSANVLPGRKREGGQAQQGVAQSGVYEGKAVAFEKANLQPATGLKTATINVPRHSTIRQASGRANPLATQPVTEELNFGGSPGRWHPQQARQVPWEAGEANRSPAELQRLPASESAPPPEPVAPGAHFERSRSRALGAPFARLDRDHLPSRHGPSAPPWNPPSLPTGGRLPASSESSSGG